jgi:hypothetical protein
MCPKIGKKKSVRSNRSRSLEVDVQAAKVLRNLKSEEAFYFYENVGRPTGECATSLCEFVSKVNTATSETVRFHLERGDFQNWIKETLGDAKLADKIGRISSKADDEKLRARIRSVLEDRLNELRDVFVSVEIRDELAVTH